MDYPKNTVSSAFELSASWVSITNYEERRAAHGRISRAEVEQGVEIPKRQRKYHAVYGLAPGEVAVFTSGYNVGALRALVTYLQHKKPGMRFTVRNNKAEGVVRIWRTDGMTY